jgi:hypothetical protein
MSSSATYVAYQLTTVQAGGTGRKGDFKTRRKGMDMEK